MYKIYADSTLIYDSTLEDLKIGKGEVTLEADKSGSFVFSLYPDHPAYDAIVKMRTVVTVYKSGRIVFRGRVLNDSTDHWNCKTVTCEGELGFLQDSILRPYTFNGSPAALVRKFIQDHNSQVDSFKRFSVGTVDVEDGNDYIARENSGYETTLANMTSRLLEDATGGHFYITHGDAGRDETPTLHYLKDFPRTATQAIEFGANLKQYSKSIKADEIATAIIPLGATVDDGNGDTEDPKLTIAKVNGGKDYVYSPEAVALYGWIFKVVEWSDVTEAANLKAKAEEYLADVVKQNVTLELNAIDLHLLDRSIESIRICDYVRVVSAPHGLDMTLLCNKQTLNLLKPDSDTVTLGHTYTTFTEKSLKALRGTVKVGTYSGQVAVLDKTVVDIISRLNALESGAGIPAGYSIIDYIESSGTQYIDAGVIPTNGTRVVMDVEAVASNYPTCFFGARTSATANNYGFVWTGTALRSDFGGTYTQTWAVDVLQRRTIDKNGPATTVDGVTQTYTDTAFTAPKTMKLLAMDNNGTVQWQISAKLYGCQIYEGGVLVRDFVPCLSARGEYGLWDRVTACFYTNVGTGEFLGG